VGRQFCCSRSPTPARQIRLRESDARLETPVFKEKFDYPNAE
jgi:hypothetical protein